MTEPGYADMVRRDVRTFAVAGALLVAALACLALWQLDVIGANGRVATLALGLLAFLVSFVGWASGDRRIRDRLFVLGPARRRGAADRHRRRRPGRAGHLVRAGAARDVGVRDVAPAQPDG